MKTIFLCIPSLSTAGAERFVTELACNLNRNKYRPIVIVTRQFDKSSSFYIQLQLNQIGVFDISGKNYFQTIVNALRLMKKEEPAILHTNIGAAIHMLIPQLLSRHKFIHIFTAHSMGCMLFRGVQKYIMMICFQTGFIIPVAICDTVKESIRNTYGIKDNQIEMVYNGVDTGHFAPGKQKNKSDIVFTSVGTLYPIKNHRFLIEAFAEAHKIIKNSVLKIIGDGELRNELENLVKKLDLSEAVIFEGRQNDVKSFLVGADIYCCTSKVEGMPLVVLEAMSCGLPIITTPAGGVIDVVFHNENGYVVRECVPDFADRMIELAKNVDARKRMGIKSRQIAMAHDIKKCASEYEFLYDKYSKDISSQRKWSME